MNHFKYIAKHRKAIYTNYYVSPTERRQLIKETSVSGLLSFEYFLYKARQTVEVDEITDQRTADWFGWTLDTAKRHRLALIKQGWFHVEKHRSPNGHKVEVYYLGKEAVAEAKGETRSKSI